MRVTSPELETITHVPFCTEGTSVFSGSTGQNPPPKLSSPPPLAATLGSGLSNAIDTFFINSHVGSGTIYGLSWIGRNGVSISKGAFSTLAVRFGVDGHEFG